MNGPALVSHSPLVSSAPKVAVTNTASQGELCARKEVVSLVRRSGLVTSSTLGANPTLASCCSSSCLIGSMWVPISTPSSPVKSSPGSAPSSVGSPPPQAASRLESPPIAAKAIRAEVPPRNCRRVNP